MLFVVWFVRCEQILASSNFLVLPTRLIIEVRSTFQNASGLRRALEADLRKNPEG